jgi:predicted ATPase
MAYLPIQYSNRNGMFPALARLVGRVAAKSQVIVVTHASPPIAALKKKPIVTPSRSILTYSHVIMTMDRRRFK